MDLDGRASGVAVACVCAYWVTLRSVVHVFCLLALASAGLPRCTSKRSRGAG